MIALALLAMQLASPAALALALHAPGSQSSVPITTTSEGSVVPIDQLGPVIPLSVRPVGVGHVLVGIAGAELELVELAPYARQGPLIFPLARAPFSREGHLFVPLQVVTELIPRLAPGQLVYDRRRVELRWGTESASPARSVALGSAAGARERPARRAGRGRRVVVDAGHGGPDHGMSGPIGAWPKIDEKDITLSVSQKLSQILRGRGIDVLMTRTTDTLIALSDRGRLANEFHGDVFVSVHVNAANLQWIRPEKARGFETYFLAEARTEDDRRVERMENEAIRFETGAAASQGDPLNFIINDMAQNEHLRESSDLAALIERGLGRIHPGPDRGVKQAGFRVLVTAYMPAVLVEIGFGTNAEESRFLADPRRQSEIAAAIADATVEYLNRYDRRLGPGSP
ncbi:MAG: N-acetylmuramoyl-L-alanine amidase [Gemmatimonadota bacterium]|nr:N-acetylmuramoyl-L-alanine amidase [Gemmatimonadota bacterium]